MKEKLVRVKFYFKDMKRPIEVWLDRIEQLNIVNKKLESSEQYIQFGDFTFSKDKFICYIAE